MAIPAQLKNKLALPAIAAPMFLVSCPDLVIEACKAGVIGSFPALNLRDSAGLEDWLITIKGALKKFEEETGKTAAPYAVNLIVIPNKRLEEDLALCIKHEVPLVITSFGADPNLVEAIHSYGGLVFHDVVKGRHAKKAASMGVDGIIAVCAGAGGHSGALSPLALIAEIRSFFDKTIILAGSVSRGQDIAAAQMLGADMTTMGTRFIATKEAAAQIEYKKMIVDSSPDQIAYTSKISGVMANFLIPSLNQAGMDDKGNLLDSADLDQDREAWKDLWSAGHGVGSIDSVLSTEELVAQLKQEYRAAIEAFEVNSSKFK